MNQKREKLTEQFHPLTAIEAKHWYKDGLLNTSGYLWAIRKIKCAPGIKFIIPNVVSFCEEWGISRSAFYRAVDQLKDKGYMSWEATHGLIFKDSKTVVNFPSDKKCPTTGTVSHERDTESHERDTESHERDTESHERDTPYIYGSRASSDISDKQILSDSTVEFSAFLIGLADEREREKFLDFGRKKAANLPEPPELPDRWVAKYHQELYAQFKATEATALAADEASQAKHQEKLKARKAAEEFLQRDQKIPDRESNCVPASQKSAEEPRETAETTEDLETPTQSVEEPKTAAKGFGVDQGLVEKIKSRKKKGRNPIGEETVEDDRVNVTPPHG